MFANFLPSRRPEDASAHERAFVREVTVKRPVQRSRRSELLIAIGWICVFAKCWGSFWLVEHYQMPFSAWWIALPTLAAAALCTWVYLRRN
ncbi:hypothetical protein [Actomonas aquatica]|uniref:Uncharacterized protein n=1 Tax=Actomonas aquatica TaxID=2866162 RepID=A0ABZ1C2B1_9BACT|nr:hypothetical protein [Opitutus sp. WL0086]WRQ85581.1 hypothetical protein K1X11_012285 [Opitutus sp. WL0086]